MYIENKRRGVRLNLLVPVGLVIVFLVNGFLPSLVMLLAAVVHEMGHILFAMSVKAPIVRFDVELWGGRMYYGGMLSYKQELFIAFGGIAANLLIAPLGMIPILGVYGKLFYYSCFCYALVNVIPARTLDGGEIIRCLLKIYVEPISAERTEHAVHLFSLLVFMVAGLAVSLLSGFNGSVMFLVFFSVIMFVMEHKTAWRQ